MGRQTESDMQNLNRFGRLGWHGGKLVLRVFVILVPVAVGALWSVWKLFAGTFAQENPLFGRSARGWLAEDPEELLDHKMYPGGVPWPENAEHYAWKGHYGDYVNEKWR